MRYESPSAGISAHRDQSRYAYAIAVLSLQGEANFQLFDAARRRVMDAWRCRPGDLVILQGSIPNGGEGDERPMHAVSSPGLTGRTSLTFRMDLGEGTL